MTLEEASQELSESVTGYNNSTVAEMFSPNQLVLLLLAVSHFNLYPELEGIYMHGGEIPNFVKDKIQSSSTERILGGEPRNTIYLHTSININPKNKSSIETLAEGFMDVRGRASLKKDFGIGMESNSNNNKPRPPQHYEDIIQGSISSNYDIISQCYDPVPSEK
ncbi:hypothetical protein C1645_822574 [Glomus cerebriforme]|uniref:Uncharacterized protein n=1 Tax=Glomus cerebriforme TaxID=658196 RepID=A0A397SZJ1_9GLOM|nr:hypothetical protein C1645_822574 [Glomus cerebriforme]